MWQMTFMLGTGLTDRTGSQSSAEYPPYERTGACPNSRRTAGISTKNTPATISPNLPPLPTTPTLTPSAVLQRTDG